MIKLTCKTVLDRILILQDEDESHVAGFVKPEADKVKPHRGTVMVVGPGGRDHEGRLIPMTVKVGDKVVYSEFATTTVAVDGVNYILIKEGDLQLVL